MDDSPQHASKRDISYASRQSDRASNTARLEAPMSNRARGWATTTEQSSTRQADISGLHRRMAFPAGTSVYIIPAMEQNAIRAGIQILRTARSKQRKSVCG